MLTSRKDRVSSVGFLPQLTNRVNLGCLAAILVCLAWYPISLPASQRHAPRSEAIIATVNGANITSGQLEAATKNQLRPLETQMERTRQAALEKLIDNLLLEQAADSENLTVEEYLQRKIPPVEVTEAEVEQQLARVRERFSGLLGAEAKYGIRRRLEDRRWADGLRQVLAELRGKARIRNYLLEAMAANLNLQPREGPSLGEAEASVVIVMFADFECPYCRKDQPMLKEIREKWPEEVRLVFKHFPLPNHQHAFRVGVASVCTERQGRFWEFHDNVFRMGQDLSQPGLVAIASSLGFDMEECRQCLASADATERVRHDISTAQAAGVDGTPTYFVNNRRVRGASELERTVAEILSPTQ